MLPARVRANERFAKELARAYFESRKPDVEARFYVDTQGEILLAYGILFSTIEMLGEVDREKSIHAPLGVIELKNGSAIRVAIKPELVPAALKKRPRRSAA